MVKVIKRQEKLGQKAAKVVDNAVKFVPRAVAVITGTAFAFGMAGCPVEAPAEKQAEVPQEKNYTVHFNEKSATVNDKTGKLTQEKVDVIEVKLSAVETDGVPVPDAAVIVIEDAPSYNGKNYRIIDNHTIALRFALMNAATNNQIGGTLLDAFNEISLNEFYNSLSSAKQIVRMSMGKIQNPGKVM